MSTEKYKAKFSYDELSEYSLNESNQDWSVIVQGQDSTECEIYNKRIGKFYHGTGVLSDECGGAYKTNIVVD